MGRRKRRKLLRSPAALVSTENDLNSQKEETAAEVLRDQVFSISLVTDCVFKDFSTSDLLSKFSFVSKIWNSAVKEYLHRRHKFLFVCKLDDFRQLKKQHKFLRKRLLNNCLPYSGIHIIVERRMVREINAKLEESRETKSMIEDIISSIDTTHTVITLTEERNPNQRCVFSSVDLLLSLYLFPILSSREVHHLSFVGFVSFTWDNWFDNVGTGEFSTLETIEPYLTYKLLPLYQESNYNLEDYEALLRTCPKLTEIPMDVISEAILTFDKYNKLYLVKSLVFGSHSNFNSEQFNVLAKLNNTLKTIYISGRCNWTPEEFKSIGRILQLHSNSLRDVRLNVVAGPYNVPTTTSSFESIFPTEFPPLPLVENVEVLYSSHLLNRSGRDVTLERNSYLIRSFPNARISSKQISPVSDLCF